MVLGTSRSCSTCDGAAAQGPVHSACAFQARAEVVPRAKTFVDAYRTQGLSRFQVAGAATADRGWGRMQGRMLDGCKSAGHRVGCRGADDRAGEGRMLDGCRWTGRDVGGMLVGGEVGGGGLCEGVGNSVGGNRSRAV